MNLYYNQLKHLIKPSLEKNIDIPLHILAKFYIRAYTMENDFYKDLNRDLSNGYFDNYRIFIFILYNALNKKIFKSFCEKTLYRGGCLLKEEYKQLENIFNQSKNFNSSDNLNVPMYFSKNFLSFSKNENVANGFIVDGPDKQPVKFIINGSKNNIFISNIDIQDYSDFKNEAEILFLPLSCFKIIDISEEFINGMNVKIIKMEYLNIYKDKLDENIKNIQNSEKLSLFFNNVLNSKYGKEIASHLGEGIVKNLKFYLETISPVKIKFSSISYKPQFQEDKLKPNFNPNAKASNPGFCNGKELNELFLKEPVSIQNVIQKSNGTPAAILHYKDGTSCLMKRNDQTKKIIIIEEFNKKGELGFSKCAFNCESKNNIQDLNTADIMNIMENNNQKYYESYYNYDYDDYDFITNENYYKKDIFDASEIDIKKLSFQRSNFYTAQSIGNTFGHFISNIDKFIDGPKSEKIKMAKASSIPLAIQGIEKGTKFIGQYSNTVKNISNKLPLLGYGMSAIDLISTSYKGITSESYTKSDLALSIIKNVGMTALDTGISVVIGEVGYSIAVTIGIVSGPGTFVLGIMGGLIFGGLIGRLFSRLLGDNKLKLNSDCLYSQYIPYIYRTKCNPNLRWENVGSEAKSFALELVEDDGKRKWLVLNIPPKTREFQVDDIIGDIVQPYQGISKNAYRIFFNLYELKNQKKLTLEDWNNSENIKKILLQVAILEVN